MFSLEQSRSAAENITKHFSEAAAVVVVNQHNKVLLMKRVDYGGGFGLDWVFPGGGVEQSETFNLAAKRELFEEAGIVLGQNRNVLIPLMRYITAPNSFGIQHDLMIYISRYYSDQTEPYIASPNEMVSWGWFDLNDVLNLVETGKMKMLQSMIFGIHRTKDYISNEANRKYSEVFVGGTFDLSHDQDSKLLNTAFESADYVYIGLEQDALSTYSQCLHKLRTYLFIRDVLNRAIIMSIKDFMAQKAFDPKLNGIVVNDKNVDYGKQINVLRSSFGISPAVVVASGKDNFRLQSAEVLENSDYTKQFI